MYNDNTTDNMLAINPILAIVPLIFCSLNYLKWPFTLKLVFSYKSEPVIEKDQRNKLSR